MSNSSSAPQAGPSQAGHGAGNVVATRYASSLIDVAMQAAALEAVQKDMVSLETGLINSVELQSFIKSPVYGADRQKAAMVELARASKFHAITANFLCVLAENRRLNMLLSVIHAFSRELAKRQGQLDAYVKTAHPMSAEQEQQLAQVLAERTGQAVRLFVEVDQRLLGGLVVTIGSQMIDDSLQSKLSRLKQAMISNSNQSPLLQEVGS